MTCRARHPPSRFAIPLRFALRDLRGGLRGFYVFIACIALGVMAIAGVNSFASSLGDGLAREGRTILGGDLAFTLIHREADATERAFLDRAGRVSAAATMRAMARSCEDARRANAPLVEIKAVDGAYPLFGAARLDPAMPLADALAERDGVYGAAAEALLLARLDLKPGVAHHGRQRDHRNPRHARRRAGPPVGRRLRSRAAADDQPGGVARDRPAAAGLAGALALSPAPGRQRRQRRRRAARDRRRQRAGAGCRLGSTRPQQCLARARAQHRALHAIPDAGRPHRAAGRRRRRGERDPRSSRPQARHHRHPEIARRHRRQRVRGLPDAGDGPGVHRRHPRPHRRRRLAVPGRLGIRIDPAAAAGADAAPRGPRARVALRPAHRARLRDLAARTRARRLGLGAVPRRGGAGAALAAADLCGADGGGGRLAGDAGGEARLRSARRRDLRRGGRRRVRLAAAGRNAGDGGGEARAAAALDRAAAGDREYPPPRRADVERRDVARARARAARDRDRGRRQSAPPVHRGAAGTGAVVLLPGHPVRRRRTLRRLHPRARARRDARSGADDARPHRVGQRRARRGYPRAREPELGAAERPRHHLFRHHPGGLARDRGRVVAARLFRSAAGFVRAARGGRARAQDRRQRRGQRAPDATSRRASPTCARSTGRASASTSRWCSRPPACAARRTPSSPR